MYKYFFGLFFMFAWFPSAGLSYELLNLKSGNDPDQLPPKVDPVFSMVKDRFNNEREFGALVSYLEYNDKSVFGLFGERILAEYEQKEDIEYESHWALTRWGEELTVEYEDIYALAGQKWSSHKVYHQYRHHLGPRGEWEPRFGCFYKDPLRYGDFDDNGEKELVLFLGYGRQEFLMGSLDFVVFSPEREEIIFSARLAMADVGDEITADTHPDEVGDPNNSQFMSFINANGGPETRAMQAYAKLYILEDLGRSESDDADRTHDILVWRKRFETLTQSDVGHGFSLEREVLDHYRLINGEYQRQNTDREQIQEWLVERNLTWAEGYPNYSECEGKEKQLIPEMHDPLLNDPEVLKGVDSETMTFVEEESGAE